MEIDRVSPFPKASVPAPAFRSGPLFAKEEDVPVSSWTLPPAESIRPSVKLIAAPLVRFIMVAAARVMPEVTVTVPLLESPMLIVPAVTRSSSASVRPRVLAASAPPRLMATPFVFCRNVTLLPLCALITAVPSKFMLLPITVAVPPLVAVVIAPLSLTSIAVPDKPPPSTPVTDKLPPPDVMVAVCRKTPRLRDPEPAPPVPVTVTVPVPPAVIRLLLSRLTPVVKPLVPVPPPVPVTDTSPPLDVISEGVPVEDWFTAETPLFEPPAPAEPMTVTVPLPPAVIRPSMFITPVE